MPLLAKRCLEPTWLTHPVYVETFGPEVADVAALANFAPDPEQELLLNLLFAIDSTGKCAAFEACFIGPRQNFKTGLIKQAELGWLFVTKERLIVHSAHELDATAEAFRDLADLIESTPALARRLKPKRGGDRDGIFEGNGKQFIETIDKQRIKYKARTLSGGRALTGNKVVLDEAFALQPSHLGSLLPTLTAVPDPQVIYASSAGKVSSYVLKEIRDRGREVGGRRLLYAEYGDRHAGKGCAAADCDHAKGIKGCALDDVERWAKIMPALGRRTTVEVIRSMRDAMPPEEFAREFMVWWDVEGEGTEPPAIDATTWANLGRPSAKRPARATVMIDVAPNRTDGTIAVAGDGAKGRALVLVQAFSDIGALVPALARLCRKRDIAEVALVPNSQAGALIPQLSNAGIDFHAMTSIESAQACAAMQAAVIEGTVEHVRQIELDAAVANARVKASPDGQVERWARIDSSVSISPLVAASGALFRWQKQATANYDPLDSIL